MWQTSDNERYVGQRVSYYSARMLGNASATIRHVDTQPSSNSKSSPEQPTKKSQRVRKQATITNVAVANQNNARPAKDPRNSKRKKLDIGFEKLAPLPKITVGTTKMVPPMLVQGNEGEDLGYSMPSSDWQEQAMNKLVLRKNLQNYCSLPPHNIRGQRAMIDTAVDTLMGGGALYDKKLYCSSNHYSC